MGSPVRVVGIDFDNTIVCFDDLFHRAAVEKGLIPATVAANKTAVRDFLRRDGREPLWTELQGYVYGVKIREAEPFPGVIEFVAGCRAHGLVPVVISHKTRYPFAGPSYDLHEAAREWLRDRGFFEPRVGLVPEQVHLELTKEGKLGRIAEAGCGTFVDDLPEFLAESSFPGGVRRILFDPNAEHPGPGPYTRAASWNEIGKLVS